MTRAAFLIVLALASAGCRKNVATPDAAPVAAKADVAATVVPKLKENFSRVHFDFDSASIGADGLQALDSNAVLLKKHTSIVVEIQGHADERGTVDYNLALGMRRADAVLQSLQAMGVDPVRVRTISYGEERPAVGGGDETAWSRNRRCEFRVTAGGGAAGTIDG